jgi:hypothetical protein
LVDSKDELDNRLSSLCICRKKKSIDGKVCSITDRKETCLGIGDGAMVGIVNNFAREMSRDEAISNIEENQNEGLILQPLNSKEVDFICSC